MDLRKHNLLWDVLVHRSKVHHPPIIKVNEMLRRRSVEGQWVGGGREKSDYLKESAGTGFATFLSSPFSGVFDS